MKNSKELISSYLSKLNATPLLSKEEEIQISKELDKNELKILKKSITSSIFLNAVLDSEKYLRDNSSYLIKLLKNITEESNTAEVRKSLESCSKLYSKIRTYMKSPTETNRKSIESQLNRLSFTNFAITTFVKPVKETYKLVEEYEKRTKLNFETLQVKSFQEYDNLVYDFYKTSSQHNTKILNCLNNQEEIMNFYQQSNITEKDIKNLKKLSKDIIKIEKLVEASRNKLIKSNLRLVVSRVKLFINKGLDFEDLIQEGNIGLMKAIDKYDYQRGYKFGTYATWWIDQTLQRAVANKSHIIRVPVYLQDLLPKVEKAIVELEQKHEGFPPIEEICKLSKVSREQVVSLLALVNQPISMETPITQDLQIKDLIIDSSENNDPFSSVSKYILKEKIREALSHLSDKNQKILRLRFGIGEERPMTLEEVGHLLGLTKERIRQLQNRSLKLLKKHIKKELK